MVPMNRCLALCLVWFAISIAHCSAQEMVVSEYYNIQDVTSEWTELVVVKDNLNVVGWMVTDANTGQITRQGGPKFNDIPLWRNLRAGTVIVLWHRSLPANVRIDSNAADGYLEMSSRDAKFFLTHYWAAPSDAADMNVADAGDVLMILRSDSTYVHALGHNKPTGAAYDEVTAPKVNFDSGAVGAGRSNRVTGRSLAAYGAGITKDSAVGGFNDSRGLPNRFDLARTSAGVPNINHWFWRETREPRWTAAPTITVVDRQASRHVIEWTPVDDPVPADSTTGYVILRDTLNFASFPPNGIRDGSLVAKGARIGTSLVLDVRPSGRGNRFIDSLNLLCGQSYTYRVYGYRYSADDNLPVTDDTTARGRQYTELRFAQSAIVQKPNPAKPLIQASRTQFCFGDTVTLTTTAVADRYEWTVNGAPVPVGGTTRIVVREPGTYRLTVSSDGGCASTSDPITITTLPAPDVDISPRGIQRVCSFDSVVVTTSAVSASYEWLRDGTVIPGATGKSYTARIPGDYQVRIPSTGGTCPGVSPVMSVRFTDSRVRFSQPLLDFGSLGECTGDTTVTVDVINEGAVDITVTSISFPPAFALASPAPGFVVKVGQRTTVSLIFTPSAAGLTQGTATLTAAPCNASASILLRGNRTEVSAVLDRASVDFGTYTACPLTVIRPDSTFRITNSGTSPIEVRVPRVDPPFYLLTEFNGPKTVDPGASLPIQIQYRPLGADRDRGVVQQVSFPFTSSSCSDTLRAQLLGATFAPALVVETPIISLGTLLACSSRVDTVVIVRNPTGVPVTITSVVANGIVASGLPLLVEPNSTATINVVVDAGSVQGAYARTAEITADPCGLKSVVQFEATIEEPRFTSLTPGVDFGTTSLCGPMPPMEREVVIVASSLGGRPAVVRGVSLALPFTTDLAVGTQFTDTLRFVVRYTPSVIGSFSEPFNIQLDPCTAALSVSCNAAATSKARTTTITGTNFGTLSAGQTATQTVTITNTGSDNLRVEALEGVTPPFTIQSSTPQLPATLQPGGTAVIEVAYTFAGFDRKDTITIRSATSGVCPDTVVFIVHGSTSQRGTVTGVLLRGARDVATTAGSTAGLPFRLTSVSPLDTANIQSMAVYLSYDASVVKSVGSRSPYPQYQCTAVELLPGIARVDITASSAIIARDTLFIVDFNTYVSSAGGTEVIVDSVRVSGADVAGTPGRIVVTADCDLEAQVVALRRGADIRVTSVTPTGVDVAYTTFLSAPAVIEVVDLTGSVVLRSEASMSAGTHTHTFNTSPLSSGTYLVILRHGSHVRSATLYLCH